MRIVFALTHINFWLQMEAAGQELRAQGHEVAVLLDREMNKKFAERFELPEATEADAIPIDWLKRRKDGWWGYTDALRELVNFLSYYHPRRAPFSETLARRWSEFLPERWKWLPERPGLCRLLASGPISGMLKWAADRTPFYEPIVKDLRKRRPDVVVAAATFLPHSLELEYLRTAKRLGIRTVIIVPSWDNLTTKGIFHVMADRILVWNAAQMEEAVAMLQVPRNRLAATGAPRYDLWFQLRPRLTAAEFRAEAGLAAEGPVIVWLCSSGFIAKDEVAIVREVAAHLAADPGWTSRGGQLLVRPHYQNLAQWRAAGDPAREGFFLWPHPDKLERFNTSDLHQGLFDTLYHSAGAVGINTSAFLEAAVVDRPCLAILDPRVAGTQSDIPHFQHLIRGGFLQTSRNPAELAGQLIAILAGDDPLQGKRREFVTEFLRPQGMGQTACQAVAGEIIRTAQASV